MEQSLNPVYQWTLQHPAEAVFLGLIATILSIVGFFFGGVRWLISVCGGAIRLLAAGRASNFAGGHASNRDYLTPPAFIWIRNQSHCVIGNEGTKPFTDIRTSWCVTNRSQT